MRFKDYLKKICDSAVLQNLVEGHDATQLLSYDVSTKLSIDFLKEMVDIVAIEQLKNDYNHLRVFLDEYPQPRLTGVSYFQRIFQIAVETAAFEILEETGELLNKPPIRLHQIHLASVGLQ